MEGPKTPNPKPQAPNPKPCARLFLFICRASQSGKSALMPWTDDDEQALCNEVLRARNGVCLVSIVR